MDTSEQQNMQEQQVRELIPLFFETHPDKDIRQILFVKDDEGNLKSLEEISKLYPLHKAANVPGVITAKVIETSRAQGEKSIMVVSLSPFDWCCIDLWPGGPRWCFLCETPSVEGA